MNHILDNPVWTALTTGNSNLAKGNNSARYFPQDVSPFAGLSELTPANFKILYDTVPFDEPVAIFTNVKQLFTQPWTISNRVEGFQMIYTGIPEGDDNSVEFTALEDHHVSEMLSLAKLTNPGPFLPKTFLFGHYEGIFIENQLIAMAGQRLHSKGYVEISAVCTHPGFTGRGYARRLILNQIRKIQQQQETAYLHVRADNTRAIRIYEEMGFETREEMIIYVIKK